MFVSIDTDALSTWAFNITDKVTLTVYDIYKIPFVENKEVMIYIINNRIRIEHFVLQLYERLLPLY